MTLRSCPQLDNWTDGDGKGKNDDDLCNHIKHLCHFPKPVVTSKLQGEPSRPIHFGLVVRLFSSKRVAPAAADAEESRPKMVSPPHDPNSNVYTSTS